MKKVRSFFVLTVIFACAICPVHRVTANEEMGSVKQRLEKIEEIEKEEEIEETPSILKSFIQKATLNGFIELNYDYVDVSDIEDKDSGSSSDLYLSSVDIALRIFFNEWAKAKTVVNIQDVGKKDGKAKISLDEAIVTVECPWIPLYFVGGKTALPFGVFEDHMISGTLTEDLYEIDDFGATLGFAPEFYGLDMSVTVYKGQDIIENLNDFGTYEFSPDREKENDINSFIANITLKPIEEMLTLATFYENEPGDGSRNQSLGGALTLNVWKFSLDAEYITALEREKG